MGYLAIEIIALLAGAAVLGFILGWALFGLGKKPAAQQGLAPANPKLEADHKAAVDARKKAEARVLELEAKERSFTDRLHERDTKVAELSHQLDDLSKLRVEAAADKESKEQRIQALEGQLRTRDAEIAQLSSGAASGTATVELQQQVAERERSIARLKAENEALAAAAAPDAPRVKEMQAEIAELRATLVATAGAAPTTASEKDAIIGRLNEEVTGLRAAYEAAEQALEEQDAAIDKLTRELVLNQQRVAQLEGREVQVPRSGVSARPASAPATSAAPAPVAVVAPVAAPVVVATPIAAPVPAPKPTTQIDEAERTVAISIADLVAKVDTAPAPAAPTVEAKAALATRLAEAGEATVSLSIADIMSLVQAPAGPPTLEMPRPTDTADTVAEPKQVVFGGAANKRPAEAPAAAAPQPAAPPLQVEANESTVAIAIASLVDQIDAAPAPAPTITAQSTRPVASAAPSIEANESTVAIAIASLVDQIDAKPAPAGPISDVQKRPAIAGMGGSPVEATAAFVVPAELLEDDDEPKHQDVNDIKRIKGIGKATAKRLRSAGITTWAQVANLTDKELPAIADLLKVSVDKIRPWVEQAKALRQG